MQEWLGDVVKLLVAGGAGGAVITLATEFLSIHHGRRDRRYAIYDDLRTSFDDNPDYTAIFDALDLVDSKSASVDQGKKMLSELPHETRHGFLALLERIALVWRSKVLPMAVLNYNFGHYTLLAYDTIELWPHGVEDRDHPYYASLSDFAKALRKEREQLKSKPEAYIKKVRL